MRWKMSVAVLVVLALGLVGLRAGVAAAGGDQPLPFRTRMSSDFGWDGTFCPDGLPKIAITGTAIGTHLGRFTLEGSSCGVGMPGEVTWFMPNGDTITVSYTAVIGPIDPETSEATITMPGAVVGGTGRFEHVQLSPDAAQTGTVWFTSAGGHLEVSGDTWISFDASDRSGT